MSDYQELIDRGNAQRDAILTDPIDLDIKAQRCESLERIGTLRGELHKEQRRYLRLLALEWGIEE